MLRHTATCTGSKSYGRMIRSTWRYAQHPVMLRSPYINQSFFISSISRTRRRPHCYSTLYTPMTDRVDARDPHSTISLASDDSISFSSRYKNYWANLDIGLNPHKYLIRVDDGFVVTSWSAIREF